MEICSDKHDEVCFEVRLCPVCDIRKDLKDEFKELEKELESVEKEIDSLLDTQ